MSCETTVLDIDATSDADRRPLPGRSGDEGELTGSVASPAANPGAVV